MTELQIALFASRLRQEEKWIMTALERRRVRYDHVDTRGYWAPLPDDGAPRYAAVLNREISATRARYVAAALEAQGSVVLNSATAVDRCADKWSTSLALRQAGLPTPHTVLAATPQAALDALEAIGYPAVVKPLLGSWGRLVTRLPDRDTAESVLEYVAALPGPQSHVVYLQEFIDKPDRDIRVIVVGGRAVGASYRRCTDWRTNVARGAVSETCTVTGELGALAVRAAAAVGADVAGVDLLEGDGGLAVLEVNHNVEFVGLQGANGDRLDIADAIASHLMARAA